MPGGSFYNRAHLIAWSISGIDGSSVFAERDLVTATRTCNTEMIPYESQVVDYLKNNPGKHVIYRVTADYHGEEPVCRGIHMEGFSLEDGGSLDFNVYIYNVQPGFSIDYSTGNMSLTSKAWAEEFTKPEIYRNPGKPQVVPQKALPETPLQVVDLQGKNKIHLVEASRAASTSSSTPVQE